VYHVNHQEVEGGLEKLAAVITKYTRDHPVPGNFTIGR
jgi:hypothetical protein